MAARKVQQRGGAPGATAADARVTALLARHGTSLMRVARQWSLCPDDAMDALQRGLEIYVRRIDTVEVATEAAWLKVVIRNEALAIRRSRADCVADPDFDPDSTVVAPDRSVEEQVLSGDRVSRSAQALRALKPDEARALMLKAHGLSYEEIGRRCGWTYTKVNRAITEGRRHFMAAYGALEAGTECERFAPVLQALAAGTASSRDLVELRPHLRGCPACRATVRDLHLARRRRIALVLPLPGLAGWILERLGGHAPAARHVPGAPVPIGSMGADAPPTEAPAGRLQRAREQITSLLHRLESSDVAAGIHIATTSGGGRVATVGAILGLCVSGIGAGTACVVTGVLELPTGVLGERHAAPPPTRHPRAPAADGASRHSAPTLATELSAVRPVPTATATRAPTPRRRTPARRRGAARVVVRATPPAPAAPSPSADPAQGTAPTSQEHAPISPAPPQPAAQEFSAAPAGGSSTTATAAAAPATGGAEFGP